jgi:transposase
MRKSRFTDEFKAEAIKQITERGHKVVDVAQRLGISDKSLYLWLRQSNGKQSIASNDDVAALKAEMSRLKAELKRTTEERDILKKAAAYFARESE